MILPPLVDPIGPNVDPVLQSGMSVLGTYMAAQLTAEGKSGVAVNVVYDSYSPSRSYPHYHGGVRVLSEAASVKIATPVDVPLSKLRDDRGELPRVRSWNHPMPWEGGEMDAAGHRRIRSVTLNGMSGARRSQQGVVDKKLTRRSQARGGKVEEPRAYVIPREQHDRSAANELIGLLDFADVEVHEAAQSADGEDVHIRKGDAVVLTRQPFGSFAQTMLESRHYPDMRQYPGGPPKHPYDSTAHSLPLNMGVTCHEVTKPPKIDLVRSRKLKRSPGRPCPLPDDAPALAMRPESNAAARVVNRLLFQGSPVFRASDTIQTENGNLPAGHGSFRISRVARHHVRRERVGADRGAVAKTG